MLRFDEKRNEFQPYGYSCVQWAPSLMKRPDRHNEIEINYLSEGAITYLVNGRPFKIPPNRLAIFWGLIPHQIIHFESEAPYVVCTIPFSQFLAWKLPKSFIDLIIQGEILLDATEAPIQYDQHLLSNWLKDFRSLQGVETAKLEMRARLSRMAMNHISPEDRPNMFIDVQGVDLVVQMTMYIAQNYRKAIKASDVGKQLDLHPDYANSLFKKTFGFTLRDYIIEERVAHAQRKLMTSDLSITAIAFDSGFQSISRFNAAFRKINGCTPRTFRQRQTWGKS